MHGHRLRCLCVSSTRPTALLTFWLDSKPVQALLQVSQAFALTLLWSSDVAAMFSWQQQGADSIRLSIGWSACTYRVLTWRHGCTSCSQKMGWGLLVHHCWWLPSVALKSCLSEQPSECQDQRRPLRLLQFSCILRLESQTKQHLDIYFWTISEP